jgi:hypothetical protein
MRRVQGSAIGIKLLTDDKSRHLKNKIFLLPNAGNQRNSNAKINHLP